MLSDELVQDVTIDCMMNVQVLWWAAAETGLARYREVAVAHARWQGRA